MFFFLFPAISFSHSFNADFVKRWVFFLVSGILSEIILYVVLELFLLSNKKKVVAVAS